MPDLKNGKGVARRSFSFPPRALLPIIVSGIVYGTAEDHHLFSMWR
jgi:hypothetical protein